MALGRQQTSTSRPSVLATAGPVVYLLDVNVLIALVDPSHAMHGSAHDWFAATGQAAWASCPITENGLLRIVGNPRYPNSPGTPAAVMASLRGLKTLTGHHFWPNDLSLADQGAAVDSERLLSHAQVTDTSLLALAVANGGKLASFDRRLVTSAVKGGSAALHLI